MIIIGFLSQYVVFEFNNENKDNIYFDLDIENKKLELNISKLKKRRRNSIKLFIKTFKFKTKRYY